VHDCIKKTWEETVEAFATIRKLTTKDAAVFQLIVTEAIELYAQDGALTNIVLAARMQVFS